MRKGLFFYLLFMAMILGARAQMKTVELDEVMISSLPFEKFISGSKVEKADSLQLAEMGQKTLATYMQQNTTVYIKERGNRMLATVSFRGTGSSHTGVYWHGINLNSLTLGNTDFNSVPMFLFDEIAVEYGGASSLHGSDAIGGSIHLSSVPQWTDGVKVRLRQDFGSFGNYFTGVRLNTGNGKWESKTGFTLQKLQNNFKYDITDRLGDRYEIEQKNAAVGNYAFMQELNRKVAKNGYFSLKGWFSKNEHQIQPLMVTTPDEEQEGDRILDRNLRVIAVYEHFFAKGQLNSSLAYVWDYQLFNESDVIETKRSEATVDYEWEVRDNFTLKAGGNAKYIVPNVWSYEEDLSEWRGDVFFSMRAEPLDNWLVNLNGRQTFVQNIQAPFAPSFSTSYTIAAGQAMLTFRLQAERSYRIPTFNDRYWGELGRPDLLPERGYSIEAGHHLQWRQSGHSLDFDIAAYYMKVDDWIAWKPTGNLWRPYNLKKVGAGGIEANGKYKWQISHGFIQLRGMYAWNVTELLKGIAENDPAVGYQLPYTPRHRFGLGASVLWKKWHFSIDNTYTGTRTGIDVINEQLDDYLLTDLSVSHSFRLGQQAFSLQGQVLNVFDIEYQNVKRYAMPGTNYLLSINILIN